MPLEFSTCWQKGANCSRKMKNRFSRMRSSQFNASLDFIRVKLPPKKKRGKKLLQSRDLLITTSTDELIL